MIATAIYLGWSFLTDDWHITWVVWPIAGILFVVVELICNLVMYFLKDDILIGEDIVFSLCVVLITVLSAVSLKLQKNMKCSSDY